HGVCVLAYAPARPRAGAIPADPCAVRADIRGPGHQRVPVRGAAGADHPRCRGTGLKPGLHAGRRGGADPHHPDLHRLELLGVPREGGGRGVSLMASGPGPLWKRLAWFVFLWLAGLAVVGAVAWLLRLWIA